MITPSENGGGGERMPLHCGPFRWPWLGIEALHAASPDAACPWIGSSAAGKATFMLVGEVSDSVDMVIPGLVGYYTIQRELSRDLRERYS